MNIARFGGSDDKESTCHAGEPGSIPGSGRSSGKGNGYPLQYSYLKNSIVRGAMGSQRTAPDGKLSSSAP